MLRIAFALLTIIQSIAQPVPQDEVKDALAHAEALYFGARFSESIALLTRVDDALKTQPGRLPEKINTKLRLALANIGLNENAKAKSYLIELYALNLDYALDIEQFSPKVIAVAAEAKAEQTRIQCQGAQEDARTYLGNGNTAALVDLVRSLRSKCVGLAAIEPEVAEASYRAGVAAYRRGEFPDALANFEAALTLSPEHELALQYIDLTQSKLQLTQDRLLLQWQRDFDTRQLTAAATDYRQIMSSNKTDSAPVKNHVTGEYRKALSALVETWNRTCPSGDAAAMTAIRSQISELLPEPSFGEDIRAGMTACSETNKSATKNASVAANTAPVGTIAATELQPATAVKPQPADRSVTAVPVIGPCLEMQAPLLLARLKKRVDPVVTNELRYYLRNNAQVVVRVKARINENGDVTVNGMAEGNPIFNNLVRTAVTEWKFAPIRDQSGPRCVDSEIPIVLRLAQ